MRVAITGGTGFVGRHLARALVARLHEAVLYLPTPLAIQKIIAWIAEQTMKIPLLSLAQLRILSEGIVEALPACDSVPANLLPITRFTAEPIQEGLPAPGPFGLSDLRCFKT